nr:ImmA/IrrE family metallo-endopeptidase [uncultured Halomonas sp.]
MAKFSENDQEEFEVYPPPGTSAEEFAQAYTSLSHALKPADTKLRSRTSESHDDVILRLALGAANSKGVMFRKSDTAQETKIQAWLSIVDEKSKIFLIQNSPDRFKRLSLENLRDIAKLSLNFDNTHNLINILAQSFGIVLIVEPGFSAMKMDGCTFKLPQGTPVIGISVRYNRYDNFWFTLMHELAHICLHYEQLDAPILDDLDEDSESDIEVEANIVAKDSLVPRQHWRLIWSARDDKKQFLALCEKAEVHPVLAAGMLRHQARNYSLYPEYHHAMDIRKTFGIIDD